MASGMSASATTMPASTSPRMLENQGFWGGVVHGQTVRGQGGAVGAEVKMAVCASRTRSGRRTGGAALQRHAWCGTVVACVAAL